MQSLKDEFSIDVTDEGIKICVNDEHPLKVLFPIKVTDEGFSNDICESNEHPLKALFPIEVTDEGIDIRVSDLQLINDSSSIQLTVFGIIISLRFQYLSMSNGDIFVIDDDKIKQFKDEHALNESTAKSLTLYGLMVNVFSELHSLKDLTTNHSN